MKPQQQLRIESSIRQKLKSEMNALDKSVAIVT